MANSLHEQSCERKGDVERCRCGSINLEERSRPPHVGLFCGDCGGWVRWIPRREKGKYPSEAAKSQFHLKLAEPKKINPKIIAHPVTLEDRVLALEHDVGVIAQLVMGVRQ